MATLTDSQKELLQKPNYGVLGTVRPDGTPQLTTVWVDAEDGHVLVNTAEGRWKERYVRRDPRVTLYVRDEDDPYRWVSITGHAELVSEGADEHIDKLARKYLGQDRYPWHSEDEHRVILRIEPERVVGYKV
jgi:PPOX class probable F420-dependent enzyme